METLNSIYYKYFDNLKSNRIIFTLLLLLPSMLIFILLLKNGTQFCCDAQYYLNGIAGYKDNGFFYHDSYLGYRSYLFPYFYALFPFEMSHKIVIFNISISGALT